MDATGSTIRVAIVGGGLAGAVLLRGLLRYPHIAVDLYEPRPSFREEGPGIDLSDTARDILQAIDISLDSCLGRAGAVYSTSDLRISTGPNAGQRIDTNGSATQARTSIGWQSFITEVLAEVPSHIVHTNALLSSIVEASSGDGLILTFADGVQKKHDVVIGADGIRGKARALVAGPDDPARKPKPTGFWGLPIQVPLERAQQFMSAELLDPQNQRQVYWIGDGTLLQHSYLDGGRDVQIMAAAKLDTTNQDFAWAKLFTPDEFEAIFSLNTSQSCQGMIKIAGICQMKHVPTRTYATKNVCLIGDAAHGLLPFQAAASSVTMEQALLLSTLLGRITSRSDVAPALLAFDEVCRPRAERAVQASFDVQLLLTGRAPGIGLDPHLLAKTLKQKWDYIQDFDVDEHLNAAMDAMDRLAKSGR